MANAYSTDLRERIVLTIDEGASCHQPAELHTVSVSMAIRWHQS
jgi:transposase